jgi:hypothetical protein
MLMQNLGFALVTPIWLHIHLAHSPIATSDDVTASALASNNPLPLATLPIGIMIAFFLPNVLMSLPAPTVIDYETKQLYCAASQFWPLILAIVQVALTLTISAVRSGPQALTEHEKKRKSLENLRICYAFALISATLPHLTAVGVPLLAQLFPALFNPAYLPQLLPSRVFRPAFPWQPVAKIASLSGGVLQFLQWDLFTGSTAVLVWALALRVQAQGRKFWLYEYVGAALRAAALNAVCGPCGVAVAVMWERDELVFARDFEKETGKKRE